MFLGMQGDLIALTADTEANLLNLPYMQFTEIVETEENYILQNGSYVTEAEALTALKDEKHKENSEKAKSAIENGYVTFKDVEFETNAQTVSDLTATMLMLEAQQDPTATYTWLSKDDKAVDLTVSDFVTLGNLIATYKNTIWNTTYITYKTAIENAETITEIEEIQIIYESEN